MSSSGKEEEETKPTVERRLKRLRYGVRYEKQHALDGIYRGTPRDRAIFYTRIADTIDDLRSKIKRLKKVKIADEVSLHSEEEDWSEMEKDEEEDDKEEDSGEEEEEE